MMRPRSSSRGRNESASVTVTVITVFKSAFQNLALVVASLLVLTVS